MSELMGEVCSARLPTDTALEALRSPYVVDCEGVWSGADCPVHGKLLVLPLSMLNNNNRKVQYYKKTDSRLYSVGGQVRVYMPNEDKGMKRFNCVLVR